MPLSFQAWTDDPLTDSDNALGVYLNEIQHNTNYARERAGLALLQWINPSAGQNFQKAHYDELKSALEDPALLSANGYSSVSEILGRPWTSLPRQGNADVGGYALLNDMRRVAEAVRNITFTIGPIWTVSQGDGFMYDQTAFEFKVTAMRGGVVVTDFAEDCTVTSDQTADTGNTIASAAWNNGSATVAAMSVEFTGSPTSVVLTCKDDDTALYIGTRTVLTNDASSIYNAVCGLFYGCRSGYSAGHGSLQAALDAAIAVYNTAPTYDDLRPTGSDPLRNPYERYQGYSGVVTCGKAQRPKVTDPYAYGIGYGICLVRLPTENFGNGNLVLRINLHTPSAASTIGYTLFDLVITEPQTVEEYSIAEGSAGSLERWITGTTAPVMQVIPNAFLDDGASIMVDLGITKSDLNGLPFQIFLRGSYDVLFDGVEGGEIWLGYLNVDSVQLLEY